MLHGDLAIISQTVSTKQPLRFHRASRHPQPPLPNMLNLAKTLQFHLATKFGACWEWGRGRGGISCGPYHGLLSVLLTNGRCSNWEVTRIDSPIGDYPIGHSPIENSDPYREQACKPFWNLRGGPQSGYIIGDPAACLSAKIHHSSTQRLLCMLGMRKIAGTRHARSRKIWGLWERKRRT